MQTLPENHIYDRQRTIYDREVSTLPEGWEWETTSGIDSSDPPCCWDAEHATAETTIVILVGHQSLAVTYRVIDDPRIDEGQDFTVWGDAVEEYYRRVGGRAQNGRPE